MGLRQKTGARLVRKSRKLFTMQGGFQARTNFDRLYTKCKEDFRGFISVIEFLNNERKKMFFPI